VLPPIKINNQLGGVVKDYVMCDAHIMNTRVYKKTWLPSLVYKMHEAIYE